MALPHWEAIESAYRAGLLSIREIASQHGITHGDVYKLMDVRTVRVINAHNDLFDRLCGAKK